MMILTTLIMAGCAGLSETEQRAMTGATIGAGAGAGIAAIAGGNKPDIILCCRSQPMNANVTQPIAEKGKSFFVREGFTESMLLLTVV
jgi:hypothetical protein